MTWTTRNFHRWVGFLAGPLILIAAGTALGLNHPEILSPRDPAPLGASIAAARAVAADPAHEGHLLLATDAGLFRSEDGGQHWEEAVLPFPAEHGVALIFDPARPGVVYAAFRRIGVYVSDDGGAVWEALPLPEALSQEVDLKALSLGGDGSLWLADAKGLFHGGADGWAQAATAADAEKPNGLRRWLHDLHEGGIWGAWGVPITDAASLALVGLVLSGYGLFFRLRWRRRKA